MKLKFDHADRTYMRHFFIGIGLLGVVSLIDAGIAAAVWSSQSSPDNKHAVAFASGTAKLVGTEDVSDTSHAIAPKTTETTKTPKSAATPPSSQAAATSSAVYSYNASQGKSLFDGTCAACHQAGGTGITGVFPPLKGNGAVNDASPEVQIETILNGRHGTVINGQKYSGVMPPFGTQFSDPQIADIANYERSSWGNHAKHVTPKQVAAIRAKAK